MGGAGRRWGSATPVWPTCPENMGPPVAPELWAERAGGGEALPPFGQDVLKIWDLRRRLSGGRSAQEVGKRYPRLANMS